MLFLFLNLSSLIIWLVAKSLQLCPILYDPMDCSLPDSSVQGILWARILEWVPCPPQGDLLNPGIKPVFLNVSLHWQSGSLPLVPPRLIDDQFIFVPRKFQHRIYHVICTQKICVCVHTHTHIYIFAEWWINEWRNKWILACWHSLPLLLMLYSSTWSLPFQSIKSRC